MVRQECCGRLAIQASQRFNEMFSKTPLINSVLMLLCSAGGSLYQAQTPARFDGENGVLSSL
jgi:hypothetical protein